MIPKIIHYCWFGNGEKSELIERCMDSWKKYMPDYEIIEWNENNFDVNFIPFVKQAYINKKWAFVSDYVRAYALYNYGGIYLDTDVEITNTFDDFLPHGAFSGFEKKGLSFTAVWGAKAKHHWPKKVLDFYERLHFNNQINTNIITAILEKDYGIDKSIDDLQIYNNDVYIYPSNYFCVEMFKNYAIHHFEGSWDDNKSISYKDYLVDSFYMSKFDDLKFDLNYYLFKIHKDCQISHKQLIIILIKRKFLNILFKIRNFS